MSVTLNSANTNVERIIAKIDNDFNPDNSDWIPRVGAWCLDAMSSINCVTTERKTLRLIVHDRIAYSPCDINDNNLKVYDANGCEIEEAEKNKRCGCGCHHFPTGNLEWSKMANSAITTKKTATVSKYHNDKPYGKAPDYLVAETLNAEKEWPGRYRINEYNFGYNHRQCEKNYVIIGCKQIELNFDTPCITIEYDGIKTETSSSSFGGCEVPVIPNNGLLIEALTYYCMYKMLCRGMKHPIMNLSATTSGVNPYLIWNELKEQARRSVLAGQTDSVDDITKLMRSNFYIQTYDPRR